MLMADSAGRCTTKRGVDMRYSTCLTLAALSLGLASTFAAAQSYPAKPVRVIVPYAAGGGTDTVARFIAQQITPQWGQQMVVDNRPGAGTNIGSEAVVRAPADGYTLLMGGAANAINMTLFRKMPYDTMKDLTPVVLCTIGANVLSAHPSLPAKTVRDIIALAKARPGQLHFASAGIGSSNHMAGELLKMLAKVNIVHVPYKGNTPSMADAVGGHVEMVFSGITATIPFMKSNRLRAIAVSSKKRFPALPDLPTFHESGVPGYESSTWFGLLAPAGTPPAVVTKLNVDVGKILASSEMRDRLLNLGQVAGGDSPEAFGKFIREEIEKYAKLIKVADIPLQ
jgi:tripartite-type tricarboxylate transporter receptor subunit TctC